MATFYREAFSSEAELQRKGCKRETCQSAETSRWAETSCGAVMSDSCFWRENDLRIKRKTFRPKEQNLDQKKNQKGASKWTQMETTKKTSAELWFQISRKETPPRIWGVHLTLKSLPNKGATKWNFWIWRRNYRRSVRTSGQSPHPTKKSASYQPQISKFFPPKCSFPASL